MLGNSRAFPFDPLGNALNTTTNEYFAEKPLFYDGYGLPVWADEAESQRVRRQPFQYKGQFGYYADVHTGLYYCHHRYYDPRMGRWLSRDPIGLNGGVNVYSYCSGDPVNLVDPDGLQQKSVGPPGPWEELIPVWGPGRDMVHEIQTGKSGWAVFHGVVAGSDVFLVRSLVTGVGKGLWKLGAAGMRAAVRKQGLVQGSKAIASKGWDLERRLEQLGGDSEVAPQAWLGGKRAARPSLARCTKLCDRQAYSQEHQEPKVECSGRQALQGILGRSGTPSIAW